MKKSNILFFGLLTSFCLCAGSFHVNKEIKSIEAATNSIATIKYCNLAFQENVYLVYAVDVQNTQSKPILYIWEENVNRTIANANYTLSPEKDKVEINEKEYFMFLFKDINPKKMTDNFYAMAKVDSYESEILKYSVASYVKNTLGQLEDTDPLKTVLTNMLNYGASVQSLMDYKTDRPANGEPYKITLENAHFDDGFNYGIFYKGETITITADEKEDFSFTEWSCDDLQDLPTTKSFELEVTGELTITANHRFNGRGYYNLINNDTEYEVVTFTPNDDGLVQIPEYYNGKPVTGIANYAFQKKYNIKNVVIPNTVKTIGTRAFENCYDLENVTMTDSVISIENAVFWACEKLKTIELSNNLTSIPEFAFYQCRKLESITLGNKITSIGQQAFDSCDSLTEISIPSSVETIGEYAFEFCDVLETIYLTNSLTSISLGWFSGDTAVKYIYFDGTKAEWSALTDGQKFPAYSVHNDCKIICNDGEMPIIK